MQGTFQKVFSLLIVLTRISLGLWDYVTDIIYVLSAQFSKDYIRIMMIFFLVLTPITMMITWSMMLGRIDTSQQQSFETEHLRMFREMESSRDLKDFIFRKTKLNWFLFRKYVKAALGQSLNAFWISILSTLKVFPFFIITYTFKKHQVVLTPELLELARQRGQVASNKVKAAYKIDLDQDDNISQFSGKTQGKQDFMTSPTISPLGKRNLEQILEVNIKPTFLQVSQDRTLKKLMEINDIFFSIFEAMPISVLQFINNQELSLWKNNNNSINWFILLSFASSVASVLYNILMLAHWMFESEIRFFFELLALMMKEQNQGRKEKKLQKIFALFEIPERIVVSTRAQLHKISLLRSDRLCKIKQIHIELPKHLQAPDLLTDQLLLLFKLFKQTESQLEAISLNLGNCCLSQDQIHKIIKGSDDLNTHEIYLNFLDQQQFEQAEEEILEVDQISKIGFLEELASSQLGNVQIRNKIILTDNFQQLELPNSRWLRDVSRFLKQNELQTPERHYFGKSKFSNNMFVHVKQPKEYTVEFLMGMIQEKSECIVQINIDLTHETRQFGFFPEPHLKFNLPTFLDRIHYIQIQTNNYNASLVLQKVLESINGKASHNNYHGLINDFQNSDGIVINIDLSMNSTGNLGVLLNYFLNLYRPQFYGSENSSVDSKATNQLSRIASSRILIQRIRMNDVILLGVSDSMFNGQQILDYLLEEEGNFSILFLYLDFNLPNQFLCKLSCQLREYFQQQNNLTHLHIVTQCLDSENGETIIDIQKFFGFIPNVLFFQSDYLQLLIHEGEFSAELNSVVQVPRIITYSDLFFEKSIDQFSSLSSNNHTKKKRTPSIRRDQIKKIDKAPKLGGSKLEIETETSKIESEQNNNSSGPLKNGGGKYQIKSPLSNSFSIGEIQPLFDIDNQRQIVSPSTKFHLQNEKLNKISFSLNGFEAERTILPIRPYFEKFQKGIPQLEVKKQMDQLLEIPLTKCDGDIIGILDNQSNFEVHESERSFFDQNNQVSDKEIIKIGSENAIYVNCILNAARRGLDLHFSGSNMLPLGAKNAMKISRDEIILPEQFGSQLYERVIPRLLRQMSGIKRLDINENLDINLEEILKRNKETLTHLSVRPKTSESKLVPYQIIGGVKYSMGCRQFWWVSEIGELSRLKDLRVCLSLMHEKGQYESLIELLRFHARRIQIIKLTFVNSIVHFDRKFNEFICSASSLLTLHLDFEKSYGMKGLDEIFQGIAFNYQIKDVAVRISSHQLDLQDLDSLKNFLIKRRYKGSLNRFKFQILFKQKQQYFDSRSLFDQIILSVITPLSTLSSLEKFGFAFTGFPFEINYEDFNQFKILITNKQIESLFIDLSGNRIPELISQIQPAPCNLYRHNQNNPAIYRRKYLEIQPLECKCSSFFPL